MAGMWAVAVGMTMALASSPAAAPLDAEPLLPTVVLHVTDYQRVSPSELGDATVIVTRVFERIGVRLQWDRGSARNTPADGRLHLDVVILNARMSRMAQADPREFGRASHVTKRASIYYAHLVERARRTGSDPSRALALVIAHEIGHMLLPEYSHTKSGLMQQHWNRRIVDVPEFLPSQATTIREMVTAVNRVPH